MDTASPDFKYIGSCMQYAARPLYIGEGKNGYLTIKTGNGSAIPLQMPPETPAQMSPEAPTLSTCVDNPSPILLRETVTPIGSPLIPPMPITFAPSPFPTASEREYMSVGRPAGSPYQLLSESPTPGMFLRPQHVNIGVQIEPLSLGRLNASPVMQMSISPSEEGQTDLPSRENSQLDSFSEDSSLNYSLPEDPHSNDSPPKEVVSRKRKGTDLRKMRNCKIPCVVPTPLYYDKYTTNKLTLLLVRMNGKRYVSSKEFFRGFQFGRELERNFKDQCDDMVAMECAITENTLKRLWFISHDEVLQVLQLANPCVKNVTYIQWIHEVLLPELA